MYGEPHRSAYISVKTAAAKWTTVKPAMSESGRLKKLVAVLDGKEERHPDSGIAACRECG